MYEDFKKLPAKTVHGSFVKLKTAPTAARKWEPSFDKSLSLIIKKCKICTHHSNIIDTEVTQFNDVVQVETIKSADENTGHILMTDLFSGFTLGATPSSMDPCTVIDSSFLTGSSDSMVMIMVYPIMFTLVQATCWTQEKVKDLCKKLELT